MDDRSSDCLSSQNAEGTLFDYQGRLLRLVSHAALPNLQAVIDSPSFSKLQATGKLSSTKVLSPEESKVFVSRLISESGIEPDVSKILEHERVHFVSYPYEWSPKMLHAAAGLTLELVIRLLPEGLGLGEANPYHIHFKGADPVLVDVTALEKRMRGDATWPAFTQFTRMFLNPLLLSKYFGATCSLLLMPQKNGISEDEIFPMCGFWQRWRQPFFSLITVPYVLNRYARKPKKKMRSQDYVHPQTARMILRSLYRHLERLLGELAPARARRWFLPFQTKKLYLTKDQSLQREQIIERFLKELKPTEVLDVGCDTGRFSEMATQVGAQVVAVDINPAAVDATWERAKKNRLPITPLVLNFAKPSPAIGWQNQETKSFLQRANQRFDTVLFLGVLPQLSIVDGLAITELLSHASQLTREWCLIEFVGDNDEWLRDLTRRHRTKELLTQERFEAKASFHFDIMKKETVPGTDRTVYLLKRRQPRSQSYAN